MPAPWPQTSSLQLTDERLLSEPPICGTVTAHRAESECLRTVHTPRLLVLSFRPLWSPTSQGSHVHNRPKLVLPGSPAHVAKERALLTSVPSLQVIAPCHQPPLPPLQTFYPNHHDSALSWIHCVTECFCWIILCPLAQMPASLRTVLF